MVLVVSNTKVLIAFLLKGYGAHRDLHVLTHSFHTRRSADRVAHQGAAHGQHRLLSTRQHAGRRLGAFLQAREDVEHVLHRPAAARLGRFMAEEQIHAHRQAGKKVAVLRHIAEAEPGDLVRLAARSADNMSEPQAPMSTSNALLVYTKHHTYVNQRHGSDK